eukprot:gnl/MRDRNA2_/MRDRNA2_71895_c0_seq1.p1 gnl/MRDRNA2_/MRDRNA2_71895_c0~~gnl/MRDRNA2_/MRDRNA2_71895_c0_seq1.p1  ORF type:complete len:949 (+),score=114.72 gnl/MRDRNA2_/MRDRNA2_71895_c0_seq1:127-2973(+)
MAEPGQIFIQDSFSSSSSPRQVTPTNDSQNSQDSFSDRPRRYSVSRRSSKEVSTPVDFQNITDISPRRCCARALQLPRLRTSWHTGETEDEALVGKITTQEALWSVIITMGVAGMRDQVLQDFDIVWYILHFFVFWGVKSASINYATRFNDDDAFHSIMWTVFNLGLTGMVTCLYHDLQGLAASTSACYALIALAYFRIGLYIPETRRFCVVHGIGHVLAVILFVALIYEVQVHPSTEYGTTEKVILSTHIVIEPFTVLIFCLLTRTKESKAEFDVEPHVEYLIERVENMHMLILVCSFQFPLGLAGPFFVRSGVAAASILLANVYSLCLKLTIMDCHQHSASNVLGAGKHTFALPVSSLFLRRHAMGRSRMVAIPFMVTFPLGVLGIALTGVGFVAAVQGASLVFIKKLLCGGSALTWFTFSLNKALHKSNHPKVHWTKIFAFTVASAGFLVLWYIELDLVVTLSSVVGIMVAILITIITTEWFMTGVFPEAWRFRKPRLLMDWQQVRSGRLVGAHVSTQEHYFTVLIAVCVFKLNLDLRESYDVELYILRFVIFYRILWGSMHYAARYNDDDAFHKIIWSLFAFGLLMMLEGLGVDHGRSPGFSIFKVSTAALFILLSVGFNGRPAVRIAEVRWFTACFVVVNAVCASLIFASCFMGTNEVQLLWVLFAVSAFGEFLIDLVATYYDEFDVPINAEYIILRFNGLLMEVLGVAVMVPNAIYPDPDVFLYPRYVILGDLLAAVMAIIIKVGAFDVAPIRIEDHAIRRSKLSLIAFTMVNQPTLFGICVIGASMPMLISSAGNGGMHAQTPFAQRLICIGSCVMWVSLSVTRLLHRPSRSWQIRIVKVGIQGVGAGSFLLLLAVKADAGDVVVLTAAVVIHLVIVLIQVIMNAYHSVFSSDARRSQTQLSEASSSNSQEMHGRSFSPANDKQSLLSNAVLFVSDQCVGA